MNGPKLCITTICALLISLAAYCQPVQFVPGTELDSACSGRKHFATLPDGNIAIWNAPQGLSLVPIRSYNWTTDETETFNYCSWLSIAMADTVISKEIFLDINNESIPAFNFAFFGNKLYAFGQLNQGGIVDKTYAGEVDVRTLLVMDIRLVMENTRILTSQLPSNASKDEVYVMGIPRILTSENGKYLMLFKKTYYWDHTASHYEISSPDIHHVDAHIYNLSFDSPLCIHRINPKESKHTFNIDDIELCNTGVAFFTDGYQIVTITPQVRRVSIVLGDNLQQLTLSVSLSQEGSIVCFGWTTSNSGLGRAKNLYMASFSAINDSDIKIKIFENKTLITSTMNVKNGEKKNEYYNIKNIVTADDGSCWLILQYEKAEGFTDFHYGNVWVLKLDPSQNILCQTLLYFSINTPRFFNLCNPTPFREIYVRTFWPFVVKGNLHIVYMSSFEHFTSENIPSKPSQNEDNLVQAIISPEGGCTKNSIVQFKEGEIKPSVYFWLPDRVGPNEWMLGCSVNGKGAYGTIQIEE